jgi:hypothetical protein
MAFQRKLRDFQRGKRAMNNIATVVLQFDTCSPFRFFPFPNRAGAGSPNRDTVSEIIFAALRQPARNSAGFFPSPSAQSVPKIR